jgi:hypothetical protein
LLNHLISEELPAGADGSRFSNSDPITGQAGWYDVRVRIRPADPGEPAQSWPQFASMPALPGTTPPPKRWRAWFAGTDKKGGAQ